MRLVSTKCVYTCKSSSMKHRCYCELIKNMSLNCVCCVFSALRLVYSIPSIHIYQRLWCHWKFVYLSSNLLCLPHLARSFPKRQLWCHPRVSVKSGFKLQPANATVQNDFVIPDRIAVKNYGNERAHNLMYFFTILFTFHKYVLQPSGSQWQASI